MSSEHQTRRTREGNVSRDACEYNEVQLTAGSLSFQSTAFKPSLEQWNEPFIIPGRHN